MVSIIIIIYVFLIFIIYIKHGRIYESQNITNLVFLYLWSQHSPAGHGTWPQISVQEISVVEWTRILQEIKGKYKLCPVSLKKQPFYKWWPDNLSLEVLKKKKNPKHFNHLWWKSSLRFKVLHIIISIDPQNSVSCLKNSSQISWVCDCMYFFWRIFCFIRG